MLSDVDAATLEILHEGPQFSADAYTEQAVANANGEMAVSWVENPGQPHLGWWTPARPGDVNGDGVVNGADLAIILGNWGTYPVGSVCGPDLDMDGLVDGVDLSLCLGDWDVGGP